MCVGGGRVRVLRDEIQSGDGFGSGDEEVGYRKEGVGR